MELTVALKFENLIIQKAISTINEQFSASSEDEGIGRNSQKSSLPLYLLCQTATRLTFENVFCSLHVQQTYSMSGV